MLSRAAAFIAVLVLAAGSRADSQWYPAGRPWDRPVTVADAWGFEQKWTWVTAPVDLLDVMDEADLYCAREHGTGGPLRIPAVKFRTLAGGLKLTDQQVRQGQFAGLWADRANFPTIACPHVPRDWTGHIAIALDIHSRHITSEIVTVGILSDNPATPWRDWFSREITVDWTGWQTVELPFASFTAWQEPLGWEQVDAIYLFAKANGHQPNPWNPLLLDDLRFTDAPGTKPPAQPAEDFIYDLGRTVDPLPLNHNFPEVGRQKPFVTGEDYIVHEPYYREDRALYRYYPRYNPGRPSFAPDGTAYIKAGDRIQWLDAAGRWQVRDLRPVLIAWAREQGWVGLRNTWSGRYEPTIRFDNDGDAYAVELIEQLDAQRQPVHWRTRTALLLHSRDGMETWQVYPLPGPVANFEKIDGHNHDALKRPPVIHLADYKYFGPADQAAYLCLPEKQPDGTLFIPEPVAYANGAITSNRHSGDGNVSVTVGDKIYITFGWMPHQGDDAVMARYLDPARAYMERAKSGVDDPGTWRWDHAAAEREGMPPIPADHPMLSMQYPKRSHWNYTGWSRNGVPTYVVAYDIPTRTLGEPVYIGSGGASMDNHNWASITVDSRGILHVVISGHIDPVVYTRTLRPHDISAWSAPVYIGDSKHPGLTYPSLNCDAGDNLYMINRSDTWAYNHRLAMYRKPAGGDWEPERTILAPFQDNYHVWWHRVAYDPVHDRLFLSYRYDPGIITTYDMHAFHRFYFPFRERERHGEEGPPEPGKLRKIFRERQHRGFTIIVSDDGTRTWRLATTPDFRSPSEKKTP